MKTIKIITPSNFEVEYYLAGAGARLGAFLIDFAVQIALIAVAALLVLLGFDRGIFGNETPSGVALGVVLVVAFAVWFGYFVAMELATRGQSVGKKLLGLRVLRQNGAPLDFWASLVRGLLRASLDIVYVGLFVILFSSRHSRLGDLAAGTIVVIERTGGTFSLAKESPEWPDFLPDKFSLTAEEIAITEEWLARRHEMSDGGAAARESLVGYFDTKKSAPDDRS